MVVFGECMRPNVDIGWETHGAIKELADARYDGDLDRAYKEVLDRGLEYSALPAQERLGAGDGANVEFIPTEGAGEPIVFHKLLGRSPQLYSVGNGPYATLTLEEFRERLSTISRYAGVDVEGAAFGLRRSGGCWVGWGFGDFLAALSDPLSRYQETEFTGLAHEEVGLVFSVGDTFVVLRGRHLPNDNQVGNVHIQVLAEGWPVRRDSSLKAVVDALDAEVVNGSALSERAQTGLKPASVVVEPLEFLTHIEDGREWTHAIVIENPFRTGKLQTDTPRVTEPNQAVMHLTSHELRDEAPSNRYHLEEYGVTDADIVNITLSGSWSRPT